MDDYLSDAFKKAVYRNDLTAIAELVKVEDLHTENDLALRLAARYGTAAMVTLLLEKGADAGRANYDGLCGTALNPRADSAAIAELLLAHGGNLYAEDGYAVQVTAIKGLADLSRVFIAHLLMNPEPQPGRRLEILNRAFARADDRTRETFRTAVTSAMALPKFAPRPS